MLFPTPGATGLADPDLSPNRIANALHSSRSTLYATLPPGADGVAAHFSRIFRDHYGLTPGQLRADQQDRRSRSVDASVIEQARGDRRDRKGDNRAYA